ncbi:MAG: hypothetical protein K8S87_04605 [Planctomycetes bacterium]|nr:hypothetical protein [Planctomycetota bacterium]
MSKLGFLTLIFLFLIGFSLTSTAVYAQADLDDGWSDDDDDGWDDDDDDDGEGWGDEKELEDEAYNKAKQGSVEDCELYLKKYPEGLYVDEITKLLKKKKDELKEDDDTNKYEGMSKGEILLAKQKEEEDRIKRILNPDWKDPEDTKTEEPGKTDRRDIWSTGYPISPEDYDYLCSGSTFWTIKRVSHAHFGLSLSRTDWKGEITDGEGSHVVINAGTEYDLAKEMNAPASVFVDFGFKLKNKNPWDTDTSAVSGWLGAKYVFKELEPNQSKGLMFAGTFLLGFGFGSREHEANLGIWLGHMNPPVFLLTPMVSAIVGYQIDKKSAINGTLGFMFFVGTEEEPDAYPLEQDSAFAINGSAEYFMAFELFKRAFGVHGGVTFRSAYDPLFSIYAKINSRLGPYMQLVIPLTSSTSSINMMFVAGYNLKFFQEKRSPNPEIMENP